MVVQEGGERFIDTLDYIFLSSHWTVTDASTHRTQAEALRMPLPFPNDVSPAHLPFRPVMEGCTARSFKPWGTYSVG